MKTIYAVIGRTFDPVICKTEKEAMDLYNSFSETNLKFDKEIAVAKAKEGDTEWTVIYEPSLDYFDYL